MPFNATSIARSTAVIAGEKRPSATKAAFTFSKNLFIAGIPRF
jgi:hypothetical protein